MNFKKTKDKNIRLYKQKAYDEEMAECRKSLSRTRMLELARQGMNSARST
jgi:hypothetical protein